MEIEIPIENYLKSFTNAKDLKRASLVIYKQDKELIENLKKENEGLKEQIEKMKCCENCKHSEFDFDGILCMLFRKEPHQHCKRGKRDSHKDFWEFEGEK